MNEFIKIYIALVVFVYLLFSFSLWQIDASQWEEQVRFLFAYLLVILTLVAVLLKKLNEK
jgi:hypothetical protein